MAVLPLCYAPDPVLRRRAKRVSSLDGSVQKLIDDMLETMPAVYGVGLAAPQVGASLRIAVIGLPDEEPIVMVNPEMVKRSGERTVLEGCLSVPGYQGEIRRSVTVTVKARDRRGKEFRVKGTELLAQALEHELDHLNGVLYLDHLESPDKLHGVEAEEEPGL
jgi:peptide deformylase